MNYDELELNPGDKKTMDVVPTPLSDPVLEAIFQDANVSGLAVWSLINATLLDSGDKPISEILSVTPQKVHPTTGGRGYRLDVEALTVEGEIVILEIQISPFMSMLERNLLYAEQSLASKAKRGDTLKEAIESMPRVIVINIVEKALRSVGGFHQVVELSYREPPYERATDRFEVHNLELDKFRKLQLKKLEKPLHLWLTALCRAQDSKTTMMEVVRMDTQLQIFYDVDPGFAQFVDRHGVVVALPDIRKAYLLWEYEQIVNALERERLEAKGEARGEARGISIGEARGITIGKAEGITIGKAEGELIGEARGISKHKLETAINMLADKEPIERIIRYSGLSREEIEELLTSSLRV